MFHGSWKAGFRSALTWQSCWDSRFGSFCWKAESFSFCSFLPFPSSPSSLPLFLSSSHSPLYLGIKASLQKPPRYYSSLILPPSASTPSSSCYNYKQREDKNKNEDYELWIRETRVYVSTYVHTYMQIHRTMNHDMKMYILHAYYIDA